MKPSSFDPALESEPGRRAFLRRATQGSLLAGAAALGAGSVPRSGQPTGPPAPESMNADKKGYHETEHTRQYYRSATLF